MFTEQYLEKLKLHFNDELIQNLSNSDKKYIEKIISFKINLKRTIKHDFDTKLICVNHFNSIKIDYDNYQKYLSVNNKAKNVTSKDRFCIFLRNEKLAEDLYKRLCRTKTNKMRDTVNENPALTLMSLDGFIARDGVDAGTAKYLSSNFNKNKNNPRKLSTWIDKGYSEQDAKEKLSKYQTTFSLDICIQKHGCEEGLNIWTARQKRWQDTLNKKSPEELDSISRSKVMNRSGRCVSKPEKEIFDTLIKYFSDIESQFVLRNGKKRFIYDIRYGHKIIEFNGSYWHCDPRLFEHNYFRKDAKLYAKDIWENDKKKLSLARNEGFDVLTIWEIDFNKDKELVIQKCVDFLQSTQPQEMPLKF